MPTTRLTTVATFADDTAVSYWSTIADKKCKDQRLSRGCLNNFTYWRHNYNFHVIILSSNYVIKSVQSGDLQAFQIKLAHWQSFIITKPRDHIHKNKLLVFPFFPETVPE